MLLDISWRGRSCDKAWIVLGYFNVVRRSRERVGKQPPSSSSMEDFNNCVMEANLFEMSYKGSWFIWDNRQIGDDPILSKIDRAFCNDSIMEKCSQSWAEITPTSISDHRILSVHMDLNIIMRKSPCRHINAWCKLKGYKDVITTAWSSNVSGCSFSKLFPS